jgi:hypothetical protein
MFVLFTLIAVVMLMCARAIPEGFEFPPEVADLKDLPKDVHGLYVKGEKGFTLDPVLHKRIDTSGLSNALDKERKKNKDFEKMVSGFKSLGLGDTPEEAKAAIEKELVELDPDNADDKKDIKSLKALREKLKAEFDDTLRKTVGEKDEQLTKMQRSMQKHMIEKEAIAALSKHKGSTELLLPHVISKLGLVEDGDTMVVRVLDHDGDPIGDGKGGFKSVEQFVVEMRNDEKYARAFDASGRSGSGTKSGEKTKGTMSQERTSIGKISDGLRNLRR